MASLVRRSRKRKGKQRKPVSKPRSKSTIPRPPDPRLPPLRVPIAYPKAFAVVSLLYGQVRFRHQTREQARSEADTMAILHGRCILVPDEDAAESDERLIRRAFSSRPGRSSVRFVSACGQPSKREERAAAKIRAAKGLRRAKGGVS